MRRISNLNSLRIGIFGTWYSLWYDKEYYTFLVYKDYKLIEYLNSIFYRLRIPTSHFYLNRINNNYYYIESNLYLTKPSFNKFTKILYYNRSIFKYISLLEYLLDFTLLVPSNLLKNKNYIEDLMLKNNIILKNDYSLFYSLFNFFSIYKRSNYIYYYFHLNLLNKLFFTRDSGKITFIKNVFNSSFNINRDNKLFGLLGQNVKVSSKKIKFYFLNFLSFSNYKDNLFYYYYNINFSFIKSKLLNFFFTYFHKLVSFYFFILFFMGKSIKITNYYFLTVYYKLYFFLRKNILLNSYKFNINKNIDFSSFSFNSSLISSVSKRSDFSYNLKLFLNRSRDSLKNKQYLNYKLNRFINFSLANHYGFFSYFYIKNFNLLVKEFTDNSIKISKEVIDMVHFKKINRMSLFQRRITNFFKHRFFSLFGSYLELTLLSYTGYNCFFLVSYYVKDFPSFDTKLISDYICFNLKRKHKITRVFNKISQMQRIYNVKSSNIFIPLFNELNNISNEMYSKQNISYLNYNNLFNIVFFNKIYNRDLIKKYNPVSGVRIEFSGPPKKAQMSKTVAYHNIIHDYKLVGKMPTHTIYADIHYYQSYVKLKRSTFGIKVWLFFHTRILNSNNVNKTIL
jgi:hypothetical protein